MPGRGASLRRLVEDGSAKERGFARRVLDAYRKHDGLSEVRISAALSRLPADERRTWQQRWADVEALGKKVESGR